MRSHVVTAVGIALAEIVLVTAGCSKVEQAAAPVQQETARSDQSARLAEMFEAYWQEVLELNPDRALAIGDYRFLDRYNENLTDVYAEATRVHTRKYLEQLAQFDPATLGERDQDSYRMLKYELEEQQRAFSPEIYGFTVKLPVTQFGGFHNAFADDASGNSTYPFRNVDDYEKALKRADGFARHMDMAIQRMKEGMATGIVQPRVLMQRVLPQLEAHIAPRPQDTVFYKPVLSFPKEIGAADRERLAVAYREHIANVIQPAYRRLRDFIAREYLPKTRASSGIDALPNGKAVYDFLAQSQTTTTLPVEEIHKTGLSEVERITREMEKVREQEGFKGSMKDFFTHIRNDRTLYFKTREEIIPAYEALRSKVNAQLPKLFGLTPRTDYIIKPVPAFSEASQPGAYYMDPSADGTRPGVFWINTYEPASRPLFMMTTLSLHEASPGHHFQLTIAQQMKDLPSFRKFGAHNGFVEGWALYAESLGKEMGLYEDRWQYYGHLDEEILRANRLVVDTGLHAYGWSREKAIAWMLDHSAISKVEAQIEVERYMADPGQALGYKLGELTFWKLRRKAQAELGPKFDLRAFHDEVLQGASLPLEVLEARIGRWIERQKGQQAG